MNWNRIISAVIVLGYIAVMVVQRLDPRILIIPGLGALFIWFPEVAKQLDQMAPYSKGGAPMDPDSPPCLFVILGWGMLFFPVFLKIVFTISSM